MTTHLNPDHSVFEAEGVKVFYNGFLALLDVHIKIPARKIETSEFFNSCAIFKTCSSVSALQGPAITSG